MLHVIDLTDDNIVENYTKVRKELSAYHNDLSKKEIIFLNKSDLLEKKDINKKLDIFKKKN